MTDTLSRFVRTLLLGMLALVGMGMALIFMVSTAIAIGVLYIVARLRGKPFGARAYWSQRRASQQDQTQQPFAGANPFTRKQAHRMPAAAGRPDVVDIDAREIR